MPEVNVSYWADIVLTVGLKIVGAVLVWLVGRWLIGLAMRLLSTGMTRERVEPTLIRYLISFLTIALNVVLVVAILGYSAWRRPASRRCSPAPDLRSARP